MQRKIVKGKKGFVFKIFKEEIPELKDDEILIKVKYCGICGTDIHNVQYSDDFVKIGHELTGVVVKTGSLVNRFNKEDLVTLHSSVNCGQCYDCQNGFPLMCAKWDSEYETPCNGFSDYVIVSQKYVFKLEEISLLEGVLMEPLDVALETVFSAGVSLGDNVAILGPGPIGLMIVSLTKCLGASKTYLTGLKVDSERLLVGKELGADEGIIVDEKDPIKEIKRIHPKGVDSTIITAHPKLLDQAVELTKFGGKIVILAMAREAKNITFDIDKFHYKKQKLISSQPSPNGYFPFCNKLLREKVIPYKKIITHTFTGPEQVEKAFKFVYEKKDGVIKAIVEF
jgi:L-iditol 2-dehydrogenase